jgi:predicted RNA binding protein YcfA (HicA-like mRNA interferase family)
MKIRDVLKLIEGNAWRLVRQAGKQYKHPTKPGKVTIAGHPSTAGNPSTARHPSTDLPPKTLKSVLKQAGLET